MGGPDRLAEIRERFETSAFHRSLLGMRLSRLEPGEAEVTLDIEDRHRNLIGLVHGGVIATLADTATGVAMLAMLEDGMAHVTTHLAVAYLAPAREGRLLARGRVIKRGRRSGYAEADILDAEGRLLARATTVHAIVAAGDQ